MTIPIGLVNDTSSERHHGCDRVVGTLEALARRYGMEVVVRVPVHADWRDQAAQLARTRLVVVNGEGTIHHDRPAARRLIELAPYLRDRGVPAALINATWYANGPALVEDARAFSLIAVRESHSQAALEEAGVPCRRVVDLALHPAVAPQKRRSLRRFTDSVRPDQTVALDRLRRRFGGEPLAILHSHHRATEVLGFFRSAAIHRQRSPRAALRVTRAALAQLRAQRRTAADFDADVASARLVVTGRFHAAIIALAAETPLLAVESNTPKLSATLADAGLSPWRVVRPEEVDEELLVRAERWEADELANVRRFVAEERRRQEELFADLRELAC